MSGYNIAIYYNKEECYDHSHNCTFKNSRCGSRVCTFLIALLVIIIIFTITNDLKQIVPSYAYYLIFKLSITASLCGSRVYIGMYIPDCMISDNNCFYYNQCFETNCPFRCILSHFEVINNSLFIIMVVGCILLFHISNYILEM